MEQKEKCQTSHNFYDTNFLKFAKKRYKGFPRYFQVLCKFFKKGFQIWYCYYLGSRVFFLSSA